MIKGGRELNGGVKKFLAQIKLNLATIGNLHKLTLIDINYSQRVPTALRSLAS